MDHTMVYINKETNDISYNSILWFETLYKAGDRVTIKVHFSPEDGVYFYAIDDNFMKSQMASINIEKRKFTGSDKSLGFSGSEQTIEFTMPGRDVELVIKEVTIKRKLIIRPDPYQNVYSFKKIQGVIYKNTLYPVAGDFMEVVFDSIVEGEVINIYIKYQDDKMKIDEDNFYGQIIPEQIYVAGEFNPQPAIIPDTDKENYQQIDFTMPDYDVTLYLKWLERFFTFRIDYPFSVITETPTYTITRSGQSITSIFNNEINLYTGDELAIDLKLSDLYSLNYDNSYYRININEKKLLQEDKEIYESDSSNDFGFKKNSDKFEIRSVIAKKDINLTLNFKFNGLRKLFCLKPGFDPNKFYNIPKEVNATIIGWGGGSRGFCYVNKNVTIKPGIIQLKVNKGAPGGGGGGGSNTNGDSGGEGGEWSFIIYTNGKGNIQKTIIFGQGGNGGGSGNTGAGNPPVLNNDYLLGNFGEESWAPFAPPAHPGSLSIDSGNISNISDYFDGISGDLNKLGTDVKFTAAEGGPGWNELSSKTHCPNGAGGAPSCGGGGEGGKGYGGFTGYGDRGGSGGVLNISDVKEGAGYYHFPLFGKNENKADIIEEFDNFTDWAALADSMKNDIINNRAGIYIRIDGDQ